MINNKEDFIGYLRKEKKKNLFISFLMVLLLLISIVFMYLNTEAKKDLNTLAKDYDNYTQYQSALKDSLEQQVAFYKNKIIKTETELKKMEHSQTVLNNKIISKNIHAIDSAFSVQESSFKYKVNSLNRYKIGIYYYDKQLETANNIKKHLEDYGFRGTIQLYKRDRSFFKSVGVQKGYEIRYEPRIEQKTAYELKNILDRYKKGTYFSTRPVVNKTPNFISVFIPN